MSATGPRVLLLEDDSADALLIAEVLKRSLPSALITRAATRAEYLQLLGEAPIDIVLSDGSVPGCEGIEAFHLARRHDRDLPFMFISDTGRVQDLRALRALGISDFLSKDAVDDVGATVARILTDRENPAEHAVRAAGAASDRLLAGHELVLTATQDLMLAADRPALIELTQATARRLTGANSTSFTVRAGDEDRSDELHSPLGDCLGDWTMQYHRPAVVDEISTDPRIPSACRDPSLLSAVVVPVRSAEPVAALGTFWNQLHHSDSTEVRLLQLLADSVAVALDNLDQRRQLADRAAARAADLADLTYAISHDLRAPIRHLEGFARILLQDVADLDPQAQHSARRIQDAAAHLREMVNGMLTLSRIGQTEIRRRPVDLAQLGREVAQSLTDAPTPAGVTARAGVVEFVVPENLPVTGDPRLLLTVVQGLLDNAWKFTARIPHPRIELGIETDCASPTYFVRDNGAGFEPASVDRLFGVFQRLHSGDDFPGIGVGLATVKRIVDKHGGTVRASGTPDAGATFFFTLP